MGDALPSWMKAPGVVPQRKAGMVVRIRVNPRDCLSILDVVRGENLQGMSFSAITSLAVSCMLEHLRQQEIIPRNAGFDYKERMAPYEEGKSTSNKRAITEGLYMKAVRNEPLPGIIPSGQLPPVETMGIDDLVNEFHQKRNSTQPEDIVRVNQIEAQLSKGLAP